MNILVIYVNSKNKTIFRILSTCYTSLKVGQATSMGWLVLDIQYYYAGRFYTKETYDEKILIISEKYFKQRKRKEKIKKIVSVLEQVLK